MSKQQIINTIRRHNPSAAVEFLGRFNMEQLNRYLSHLAFGRRPRGGRSFWIRRDETPAVVARAR